MKNRYRRVCRNVMATRHGHFPLIAVHLRLFEHTKAGRWNYTRAGANVARYRRPLLMLLFTHCCRRNCHHARQYAALITVTAAHCST